MRVRAERNQIKLWPAWYLWSLGLLINAAIPAALAALSWKRLGFRARAISVALAGLGCLMLAVIVALDRSAPRSILTVANVVGTSFVVQGLGPRFKQHRAAGGARGSLLLPIGVAVAVFFGLVLVIATIQALRPGHA